MAQYKKFIQNNVSSPISNSDQSSHNKRTGTSRQSRSKDQKNKLNTIRSKQVFLTDTQTSDYTKSSNDCGPSSNSQSLNQIIKKLKKQNNDLKQQIIEIKSAQFFNINPEKLKDLIVQNQKLKNQIEKLKKSLDESFIERDFLQRFSKNLKNQCQQLTRQIIKLGKERNYSNDKNNEISDISMKQTERNGNVKFEDINRRIERYSIKRLQQMNKSRNSHRSQQADERLSYRPKDASKNKVKQVEKLLKKSRSSSKVIDNQYFIGKGIKDLRRPRRTKKNQED